MAKASPPPAVPEYDKINVGRRFRKLRIVRGMTPTEWSVAIGDKCTPQKICNYEAGDDQVPLQFAARACILTGASFDYIYRGMVEHLDRELLIKLLEVDDTATNGAPKSKRR